MEWIKKGLIYSPEQNEPWLHSHCQLPVADLLEGDIYRIYFASRTEEQRSHIAYVDINLNEPDKILNLSSKPVLEPGPIGFFDEHGVYPSCIVNHGDVKYLYYIGWNQGVTPPLFYANIGLAISVDNGKTYTRHSKAPVMARGEHDPCLVTSPHVYRDEEKWKMTYVSGIRWEKHGDALKSYYHIKYAESDNGIDWNRDGIISIDFQSEKETNIGRSWVIKEDGLYKMWYSYVMPPKTYRIGYAESVDGKEFKRMDDQAGIDVSQDGFDSEMMCYPCVIVHKGRKYMFYNGNRFGQKGFALAVSEG